MEEEEAEVEVVGEVEVELGVEVVVEVGAYSEGEAPQVELLADQVLLGWEEAQEEIYLILGKFYDMQLISIKPTLIIKKRQIIIKKIKQFCKKEYIFLC